MTAKSLAAAQYILECANGAQAPSVTPMQLLKLVYIAHGYMLGQHGEPLLDEPVHAWRYGPVVPSVYRAVKSYRSAPVDVVPGALRWSFSPRETDIMERVVTRYGHFGGTVLSAATHRPGTPWSITWQQAEKNDSIADEVIEGFYQRLLSQPTHSAL